VSQETLEGALAAVREVLGMDAAYLAEFTDGRQLYRAVEGDTESFGLVAGEGPVAAGTYCVRVLDGSLPNVIPDTAADRRVSDLAITRDAEIGSYVAVPLRFPDGTRGTICCLSHEPDPGLADRDIRFVHAIARLVEDRLIREAAERDARRSLDRELIEHTVELRSALSRLSIASVETVLMLSKAVEYRDDDTGSHTARVGRYAAGLAEQAGLEPWFCEQVLLAAPLHDAGKVGIPDAVLLKPGRLTDEERSVMERHALIGYELLRNSSAEAIALAASIAHTHHERFDGSGYPRGLAGEEIPLEGRVTAIADVFDALSSDRVYRPAFAPDEVVEMLRDGRGSQFDPELLDVFVADLPETARA
jgi:hypothetical protein